MGKRFKVVITDYDFGSTDLEQEELAELADLCAFQCRTEEEVIAAARDADALLVQYAPITARVLDSLPRCRVISRYGIGVDMIDLQAAAGRGIQVVNVPDYCIEEVSDHAVALILACVRKLPRLDAAVHRGRWDVLAVAPVSRLRDCTVGLVGLGNIARRVAEKLKGFGCPLVGHDPYVRPEAAADLGVGLLGLPELLERADVVSLHAPLTPQTRHMIGEAELRRMKNTALLINTSRGPLIDEPALCRALEQGWIAGAGLDVLEHEPVSPDNLLLRLDNALLTPHAAFYSARALEDLQRLTARAVAQVLRGEPPRNPVNRPASSR